MTVKLFFVFALMIGASASAGPSDKKGVQLATVICTKGKFGSVGVGGCYDDGIDVNVHFEKDNYLLWSKSRQEVTLRNKNGPYSVPKISMQVAYKGAGDDPNTVSNEIVNVYCDNTDRCDNQNTFYLESKSACVSGEWISSDGQRHPIARVCD